jgi:hypothetical protein
MGRSAAPDSERIEVPALTLRADVRAESVDREARTVEVIFSTGAPVDRYDWMTGARYVETLSLEKKAIRWDRLNSGAPFLNAHSAWAMGDVLGVVVAGTARIEGGVGRATVRFSKRSDVEPIWQDVQDGIIRNVSVGYRVHKYEKTEEEGKPTRRHAVDWEPFEISAVPMGADPGAQVRAPETVTYPCELVRTSMGGRTMEPTAAETVLTARAEAVVAPTEVPGTEPTERDRGAVVERERIAGILKAAKSLRLPVDGELVSGLIRDGVDLSEARGKMIDTVDRVVGGDKGPQPGGRAVITSDPLENVWRGITGALLHRVAPQYFPLDDNARQYRTHSVLRAAEECLAQRGVRSNGMSKMEIASLALGLHHRAGLLGTSDFPNILADVANKTLRAAYDEAPQTFSAITRRTPVPDFKLVKRNQIGEAPQLQKVLENGEFTRGSVPEAKEQYAITTWGRIIGISRQALVNDDLTAFSRFAVEFGRQARSTESDLVWYQILKNANMGDGVALFDASTHKNYTSSGTAIDVTSLGVGLALMLKQVGLDARSNLNLMGRYLIVPPSKQTLALQYTTVITPALGSSVNPWAGRLQVITEPRLESGVTVDGDTASGSAVSWYLAADLAQTEMLELGYLDG